MSTRTNQIRAHFNDLADKLERAPRKYFGAPMDRGEFDDLLWLRDNRRKLWSLLPSRFRQEFYRRAYQYGRRQRYKLIGSDMFRTWGPEPYDRPAPDSPAVAS